jgi:hypothetical protein
MPTCFLVSGSQGTDVIIFFYLARFVERLVNLSTETINLALKIHGILTHTNEKLRMGYNGNFGQRIISHVHAAGKIFHILSNAEDSPFKCSSEAILIGTAFGGAP